LVNEANYQSWKQYFGKVLMLPANHFKKHIPGKFSIKETGSIMAPYEITTGLCTNNSQKIAPHIHQI
jgi:hypothetical protein